LYTFTSSLGRRKAVTFEKSRGCLCILQVGYHSILISKLHVCLFSDTILVEHLDTDIGMTPSKGMRADATHHHPYTLPW
jgi:hypothetical protein